MSSTSDIKEQEQEQEVEVEVELEADSSSSDDKGNVSAEPETELEDYSERVQKRINKLTAKAKQEERDREEAVRVAQQLKSENDKLRKRMTALDSGYISEREKTILSQLDAVKRAHKEAYESGDQEKLFSLQEKLSALTLAKSQVLQAKNKQKRVQQQAQQQPQQVDPAQQPAQQQVAPDPKAEAWAAKNEWFGEDSVMTASVFAIHNQLQAEGIDGNNENYYTELDKRVQENFPHKFPENSRLQGTQTASTVNVGGSQVASATSSASRSNKQGRSLSVKLTPSMLAIAKRLRVSPEDYAKQYAKLEGKNYGR